MGYMDIPRNTDFPFFLHKLGSLFFFVYLFVWYEEGVGKESHIQPKPALSSKQASCPSLPCAKLQGEIAMPCLPFILYNFYSAMPQILRKYLILFTDQPCVH